MKLVKVQIGLFAIWSFNLLLNILPGSFLRVIFLRVFKNSIGRGVGLHSTLRFTWPTGLKMGDDSTINFDCFLDTRGGIVIGDHVMIGHKCGLYTATHKLDSPHFEMVKRSISIGNYAVVFPNVLIMPGVSIGEGAVVLPGSVVGSAVEPYSIVGGTPARHIRHRTRDLRYELKYQFFFPNS